MTNTTNTQSATRTPWTDEDSAAASAQGWNLFDCEGEKQLQREDEIMVFSDDFLAAAFVKNQAQTGNALAIKAIACLVETGSGDVAKFSLDKATRSTTVLEVMNRDVAGLDAVQKLVGLMKDYEGRDTAPSDSDGKPSTRGHLEWLLLWGDSKNSAEALWVEGERYSLVITTLIDTMECQLMRQEGHFHLSQDTMWQMWSGALEEAREFLENHASSDAAPVLSSEGPRVTASFAQGNTKKPAVVLSAAEIHLKKRADALESALKKFEVNLKHSQVLTLLARIEGYKGFSALKVALARNVPGFCPHCGAAGTLKEADTVFCEQGESVRGGYEAEGNCTQYVCSRCSGQFADWEGLEEKTLENVYRPTDTFDVKVYKDGYDEAGMTVGTYDDWKKACKRASAELRKKTNYTVHTFNNRTGEQVDA